MQRVPGAGLLDRALYTDTATWLPDDLLVKADKITMANSVELRVPLLDHHLLEFAASLPTGYKVSGGETKRVLKAAFARELPDAILSRKKAGFPVPYGNWLRGPLAGRVRDVLLSDRARSRGYFQPRGVEQLLAAGAQPLVHEAGHAAAPRPFLAQIDAATFIARSELHEEVFGPSSLVVRAHSVAQLLEVLQAVSGSLTVTLWGAEEDSADNRALVRGAMAIAGRVLFSGVPTGVAVSAGQQHGGPWPASTQPLSTSVGDAALDRFLRPVCLQDAPAWLLARQGQPV